MATGYTQPIYSGKDLSMAHFICDVAFTQRIFEDIDVDKNNPESVKKAFEKALAHEDKEVIERNKRFVDVLFERLPSDVLKYEATKPEKFSTYKLYPDSVFDKKEVKESRESFEKARDTYGVYTYTFNTSDPGQRIVTYTREVLNLNLSQSKLNHLNSLTPEKREEMFTDYKTQKQECLDIDLHNARVLHSRCSEAKEVLNKFDVSGEFESALTRVRDYCISQIDMIEEHECNIPHIESELRILGNENCEEYFAREQAEQESINEAASENIQNYLTETIDGMGD